MSLYLFYKPQIQCNTQQIPVYSPTREGFNGKPKTGNSAGKQRAGKTRWYAQNGSECSNEWERGLPEATA